MTGDVVARAGEVAAAWAGRAADHDRDGAFPAADVEDLRRSGLLGLLVPESLGGLGDGFATYVEVARALGRGNGASALLFNMHASVTGALAGTDDDLARALGAPDSFFAFRDRVLRAAAGGAFYAVAISEARAGSRLSAVETTYAPAGDGYRIVGAKSACSGAGHADGYLVAARTADAGDGGDVPAAVSYFLVEGHQGVEVEPTWDPLGMRATASHGLRLDVQVPADALLGGVEGLALLLARTMPQWLVASYAARYAGVARAAVDAGRAVLAERDALGATVGEAARARLGRADAEAAAAEVVVREAGRRVDEAPGDDETNAWCYRAKLVAGDTAMAVAASVAEACGLGGLSRGGALERIFRDARTGAVMPPRSDACAAYLGAWAAGRGADAAFEEAGW